MDAAPKDAPQASGTDSADFRSELPPSSEPRVLPVIVQPVVPETTGAIASFSTATVPRPSEGTIRVIDTAGLSELNFNFPPSAVHIAALDVDLVMVFSDNSKLILPNLAMGLLGSNPPKLNFEGKAIAPQDLVGAINQVTLAEATPSIHLASSDFLPKKPKGPTAGDQENATGHDGVGGGEPPIPPPPIVSGAKYDKQFQSNETKTGDFTSPPVKEVPAGSLSVASSNSAVTSPSVVTPIKPLDEQTTSAAFAFDSVVSGRLLQTVGFKTSGTEIKGATGTGSSDTNPDYTVQTTREALNGTGANEEIWGEDPESYPAGTAGRSLQITYSSSTVTTTTVTISGVPDSITILNATYIGGGIYKMKVDPGNTFTMKLAYKLPPNDTGLDSDKYYSGYKYTFSFEFAGTNKKGEKGTVTASATVGIRDVGSAGEQIGTDPKTGKLVVGLPRDPTGNIVNAGDGNDTIHGAAGADSIDGGDGTRDRVVYDLSNDAVSVSLADHKGENGFARGDTYINVEDVIGSDYNDTLIGDDGDNLLSGGKGNDLIAGGKGSNTLVGGVGADTLDGTAGTFDLVDYSASKTGVTVDLNLGTGSGGDAEGDVLNNIEAVIGSQFADLLIAGLSNSSIFGGDGNDTIGVGDTENSVLDGGSGSNTLDYDQASSGVTATLGAADTKGNQFKNFANLSGSKHDDVLKGDDGNNVISGGKGNDSLLASKGSDLLDGGEGTSDTVDYSNYNDDGGLVLGLKGSTVALSLFDSGSKDNIVNVENVIGTKNDDRITGDDNANLLQGGQGSDTLSGKDGHDTLLGGDGADRLSGGIGNDTIIGGGGADSLFGGAGSDLLRLDWSSINLSKLDAGSGTDTVSFANSTNDITLSGSSFSNLLSNAEYIDFSGTNGTVSLSLGGDDVQKLLTGSSSSSSYAGVLDLKFDASGDSLSLLNNGSYSYWNSSDVNATTGKFNDGTNFSISGSTQQYVYVFDTNHTTLLATLYLHT